MNNCATCGNKLSSWSNDDPIARYCNRCFGSASCFECYIPHKYASTEEQLGIALTTGNAFEGVMRKALLYRDNSRLVLEIALEGPLAVGDKAKLAHIEIDQISKVSQEAIPVSSQIKQLMWRTLRVTVGSAVGLLILRLILGLFSEAFRRGIPEGMNMIKLVPAALLWGAVLTVVLYFIPNLFRLKFGLQSLSICLSWSHSVSRRALRLMPREEDMAFQMIRHTAKFEIDWGEELVSEPLVESRKKQIGEFYHAIKCPLYHLSEGGTVEQGIFEVDRWLDHHRKHGDVKLAMSASTVVSLRSSRAIVGVCLVNACEPDPVRKVLHQGGSIQHIAVAPEYRRQGLATKMVQRALTIIAEKRPAFDAWVEEDDEVERGLYEKLDFVFTGVED